MPYYKNTATGDTGYLDQSGGQWEILPGGKNLPVTYMDFTPEQIAATGGGHLGWLSGEYGADRYTEAGGGSRPSTSFSQDPATHYVIPRVGGLALGDWLRQNKPGAGTSVWNPQAVAATMPAPVSGAGAAIPGLNSQLPNVIAPDIFSSLANIDPQTLLGSLVPPGAASAATSAAPKQTSIYSQLRKAILERFGAAPTTRLGG